MTEYLVRWLDGDGCVVDDIYSSMTQANKRYKAIPERDPQVLVRSRASYGDGSWHYEYHSVLQIGGDV